MFNKKNATDSQPPPKALPLKKLFHHTTQTEKPQRKLKKLRRSYIKERKKQRNRLNQEIANLTNLLKENFIDQETYERLKKILEISNEQKRRETRKKHGFSLNYHVFQKT